MTRSNNGGLGSGKYIQENVAAVGEFNALPKALTCYGAHLATYLMETAEYCLGDKVGEA
jgi:hypothetical protein